MVAKFKVHTLTLGTAIQGCTKFFFTAPNGQYAGMSAETGITEATTGESAMPKTSVGELLLGGVASRLNFTYTKAGKTLRGKLIVATDKADTARADLVGKAYNGGIIKKVYVPRQSQSG